MGRNTRKTEGAEHTQKIKIVVEILSDDAEVVIDSIRADLTPSNRFKFLVGKKRVEIEAHDPTAARAALHSVLRLLSLLSDVEVVLGEG